MSASDNKTIVRCGGVKWKIHSDSCTVNHSSDLLDDTETAEGCSHKKRAIDVKKHSPVSQCDVWESTMKMTA
jgi:hypothetical protein